MIHTSRQLKAVIRNESQGDGNKAQLLIRNYAMERFMERISLSPYRDNLIFKGGVLVASLIGLQNRSTMDVDATVNAMTLSLETAQKMVQDITGINLDDNLDFRIQRAVRIVDEAEYAGVRVFMDIVLDEMHTPLKVDFSTGDPVTPREVEFSFRLHFEDRSIQLMAYNMETLLAEKLETLLSRGTANTRMRDLYDIYALDTLHKQHLETMTLRMALHNTIRHRGSIRLIPDYQRILTEMDGSQEMIGLWVKYCMKFEYEYAAGIEWAAVMQSVRRLLEICLDDS